MLKVESVFGFEERPRYQDKGESQVASNARRGGFVHGTTVATTSGWRLVEDLQPGDLVRTLDNGFRQISRVSTDSIVVPSDEAKPEYLPIRIPSNAAYNGRPVWIMPEQGVALDDTKLNHDPINLPVSLPIVPARLLSGTFRIISDTPSSYFDVTTLFFDQDEVIYIEGGFRAFCPSGRFGAGNMSGANSYTVAAGETAAELVNLMTIRGDIAVLANSLGALPAPIMEHPIMPMRPVRGVRRPGRPGRPVAII